MSSVKPRGPRRTPGLSGLPLPPARPEAVLVLQLLLSGRPPDLAAVSDLIRSDIGLLVQAMRLAGAQLSPEVIPIRIEEIVVLLGLEELRGLSETASILAIPKRGLSTLSAFDRFSTHAQLTALIAQELASEIGTIEPEEAYVAGLCRRITALPVVLGWTRSCSGNDQIGAVTHRLAEEWQLPDILVPIIAGNRAECPASSLALFDLIESADARALSLECGYEN